MCDHVKDRAVIAVLQKPLRLTRRPFTRIAKALDMGTAQVIETIQAYLQRGVFRRFAGIVKHDRAGFSYNAMIVFEVDAKHADTAGEILSRHRRISHCYRRNTYPDWPYNLYAMMHAHDAEEFNRQLDEIKDSFAYASMMVLPTIREFKKTQKIV